MVSKGRDNMQNKTHTDHKCSSNTKTVKQTATRQKPQNNENRAPAIVKVTSKPNNPSLDPNTLNPCKSFQNLCRDLKHLQRQPVLIVEAPMPTLEAFASERSASSAEATWRKGPT